MTNDQLQAIKAELEQITPGPWTGGQYSNDGGSWLVGPDRDYDGLFNNSHDGPFIAKAPERIAALVAEIERLREPPKIKSHITVRGSGDDWSWYCDCGAAGPVVSHDDARHGAYLHAADHDVDLVWFRL